MINYQETSIPAVFHNRAAEFSFRPLASYKSQHGWYLNISWAEMQDMVISLGKYMIMSGLKKGEKAAIFSPNRYEWWATDLASLSIDVTDVPIYATNSAEEARYVLENSDSKICFVGTKEHLDKVLSIRHRLPELEKIVIFDNIADTEEGVITFEEAVSEGRSFKDKGQFEKRLSSIAPDDLATIIYTSGTTGHPKGVMLTHANILANTLQGMNTSGLMIGSEQCYLSFLPLSHGFERVVGYYCPIYGGKRVFFSEGFAKLPENIREVRPTIIATVPRLLEKIHAGVLAKVSTANPIRKALFEWATGVAKKNIPHFSDQTPRKGLFALEYFLADRLVLSKLKKALGIDRIVIVFTGGGPLAPADMEFFLGMEIRIVDGYGITEASPVVSRNIDHHLKVGTLGPPFPRTGVKIADDGEILLKGPQIMSGYYRDEAATKEAFTEDGFFRTGDIGEFDEEGHIRITGRKKDIMITSGGKNVSPQNIENAIKISSYIEQVAIIGDNRKYLSALVVPAFDTLSRWAAENAVSFSTNAELISNEKVIRLFSEEIQKHTKDFARVEQIKAFRILAGEWTQETGELTPTLKIKRKIINERYSDIIESMYGTA